MTTGLYLAASRRPLPDVGAQVLWEGEPPPADAAHAHARPVLRLDVGPEEKRFLALVLDSICFTGLPIGSDTVFCRL